MEQTPNTKKFQFRLIDYFKQGWKIFSANLNVLLIIMVIGFFLTAIFIVPSIFSLFFSIKWFEKNDITLGLLGMGLCILGFILVMLVSIIYQIALIFAVKYFYEGKSITVKEAFYKSFTKFWPILGAGLIVILLVLIGFVFLFIPGLILIIYFYFFQYIIVDENLGAWQSIKRSIQIVKGKFWYVLLFFIIITSITIASTYAVSFIAMVFTPFWVAITYCFYQDLKKVK